MKCRDILSLCDLQNVKNLDDAYDAAYNLEFSEINSKVKSLLRKFMKSEEMINFILSVLEHHVSKLEEFSISFGDEELQEKDFGKKLINLAGLLTFFEKESYAFYCHNKIRPIRKKVERGIRLTGFPWIQAVSA